MPKDGFKAITVSKELWDDLKARAEKQGLSLPQLIDLYRCHPHSINDLLWLDEPSFVRQRMNEIISPIREAICRYRVKQRALEQKRKFLAGEAEEENTPLTEDESRQLQEEATNIATQIAQVIIEKDRETYEEFKKAELERRTKIYVQNNKESLRREIEQLFLRAENLASQVKDHKLTFEQHIEFGDIAKTHESLKEFVPYLPEEAQTINQKTEEILRGILNV